MRFPDSYMGVFDEDGILTLKLEVLFNDLCDMSANYLGETVEYDNMLSTIFEIIGEIGNSYIKLPTYADDENEPISFDKPFSFEEGGVTCSQRVESIKFLNDGSYCINDTHFIEDDPPTIVEPDSWDLLEKEISMPANTYCKKYWLDAEEDTQEREKIRHLLNRQRELRF